MTANALTSEKKSEGPPAFGSLVRGSSRSGTPRVRRSYSARLARRRSMILMAPAAVFLAVFCLYPLEELVRMSVSKVHSAELLDSTWKSAGFANYSETIRANGFTAIVVNTVVLMLVVVLITVFGGVASAFILQRRTKTNQAVQGLMVFLWALPPLVTASVWKFLLSGDGLFPALSEGVGLTETPPTPLVDPNFALLAVAVVIAWVGVTFASLIMRAGLLGVDRSQLEAADVDGVSRWQSIRFIILPALRPAILVQALLAVIYAFRVFDYPFIMTSGGPGTASTTLPYLAYKQSFGALEFGEGAATAVMSVIVVIVLAVVYVFLIREEDAE